MRRAIADPLRAGVASTAQLTLTADGDVTILAAELERLTEKWGRRASTGLIVPVVREADRKDLETLRREIADLAERARDGTLAPAEPEGGCTASPTWRLRHRRLHCTPQPAAVGHPGRGPGSASSRGRGRPNRGPDASVLSLTFDHHVVDGAPEAAFLADVVRHLQSPDRLLS